MRLDCLISAEKLTLAYGENKVISSADFEIKSGDFVCVVGANGSGKSTLIKAILGFIRPKSGKIHYASDLAKTEIGYLPQESKIDPNFPATVYEIVLSGTLGQLGLKPFYRPENKTRALDALKSLRIEKLKSRSFGDLSGGQKQKVLLSRALAATSRLLILDEPSNNLDHASRHEFYEILKNLNRSGLTIIMITHDLDADDLIGDKVLALKNGEVSSFLTADFLRSFK